MIPQKKKVIFTDKAPRPVGAYSQAVESHGLVFISGQIAIDPGTNELVTGDFAKEVKQVITNLKEIIKASGADLSKVLKITVYMADITKFEIFNNIYSQYFDEPFPARAVVEVSKLPKNVNIEIEAVLSLNG